MYLCGSTFGVKTVVTFHVFVWDLDIFVRRSGTFRTFQNQLTLRLFDQTCWCQESGQLCESGHSVVCAWPQYLCAHTTRRHIVTTSFFWKLRGVIPQQEFDSRNTKALGVFGLNERFTSNRILRRWGEKHWKHSLEQLYMSYVNTWSVRNLCLSDVTWGDEVSKPSVRQSFCFQSLSLNSYNTRTFMNGEGKAEEPARDKTKG